MAGNVNQEIKEAMKEKKIVIGSRTVIKCVKGGHINNVIYASNCPEETRKDLEYYSKSGFLGLKEFKGSSVQLGELCGKPFNVLLVGIKK
jgi:large subunit ribosomal protein L30e